MKKALLVNTLILTITSLALRTVNISFRVYISNKIGAEGIGLYQLVFSVYALASTFATSGISTAVTRLAAEEMGRKSYVVVYSILKKSFTFSLILSTLASLLLLTCADYIGTELLNDSRTVIALKILAPGLPFMAVSSCLRGYFYAARKVIRPVSGQILEQFARIYIIIYTLNTYSTWDLEHACAALVFGTTAAEVVSCVYVSVFYYFEKSKYSKYAILKIKQNGIVKRILSISLPVAASSYVRSGLRTVENILIPAGFKKFGATNRDSLAEYGMIRGMVMPILTFPSAFLSAFSTLLIPEISEANALNHKNRVNYAISRVFQMTLLMSILVAGVFISLSNELGTAIYNNEEVGAMLKILAPLIPLMYLDRMVDATLKALNQQVSSLTYNILDSLARIGMIYYLIPMKGTQGFIIVIFASSILNSSLSIGRLLRVTRLKVKIFNWIFIPTISVTASGSLVSLLFNAVNLNYHSSGISVTIGIILMSALYLTFLLLLDYATKDDINWFKSCFYIGIR